MRLVRAGANWGLVHQAVMRQLQRPRAVPGPIGNEAPPPRGPARSWRLPPIWLFIRILTTLRLLRPTDPVTLDRVLPPLALTGTPEHSQGIVVNVRDEDAPIPVNPAPSILETKT